MSTDSYRKVSILSATDAAYIAGIVDGEGTVTLCVKQKGGTRHLAVTVSNTDLSLIKYLHKTINAGKVTNKKIYKEHHLPSYTYAIYSRQALDLLEQIVLYLRTYKLQRANLVLDKYVAVTPRNGKYSEILLSNKEKFVSDFFKITPN